MVPSGDIIKTLDEIKDALSLHREELGKKYKVKEIGIFGSYVTGRQRKKSDLYVLVSFEEPIGFFKFMELEDYLGSLFGIKVDRVTRGALKPHIGENILKEVVYL